MESFDLRYLVSTHVAVSIWLGILAARWKQRSAWRWFITGLFMSVFGLVLLARLERISSGNIAGNEMQLQYMDGTEFPR
jgi:hypothetical protein